MADVRVRVTLDTQGAKKEAQSLARDLSKTMENEGRKRAGGGFGFASSMGAAAGLYRFFYGSQISQGMQEIQAAGNVIGRASPGGQEMASFYGKMGARRTAAEQTEDFFGIAGSKATREQILAVYSQLRDINALEAAGKARVGDITSQARVDEGVAAVAADLEFAAKNLGEVTRQLSNILFPGRR